MKEAEFEVLDLLSYLQEMLENSAKMPMTGKVVVDKKDFNDTLEQIINYLPEEFKKSKRIISERERVIFEAHQERERILSDAKREYENACKRSSEIMRNSIENNEIVSKAKKQADAIIASAQNDAKAIRIGCREYSMQMLLEVDKSINKKRDLLIKSMQQCFEETAKEIDGNLTDTCREIRSNLKELKDM